jgi:hypothetical protein
MARSIIAVIVAFILLGILQVASFMTMYGLMGTDWSFKPASYQPSTRWTAMQLVIIMATSIIAGLICVAIAKGGRAPLALAAVVLVVSLGAALLRTSLRPNTHEVRIGSVSQKDARDKASHPMWVMFLGPFIGAVGVVIGGKLRRRA